MRSSELSLRRRLHALPVRLVLLPFLPLLASGPSAYAQETGLSRCSALDVPRHAASTALASLLESRSACLGELATDLETTSEALAQKHGEQLPQLYAASETSSFLRAQADGLRVVATSNEVTIEALDGAYVAMVDATLLMTLTLNQLGDDAQLANVDLQNVLQKQQQTLQMMSNISKMLYDTAQSVIRKIGG